MDGGREQGLWGRPDACSRGSGARATRSDATPGCLIRGGAREGAGGRGEGDARDARSAVIYSGLDSIAHTRRLSLGGQREGHL